jgi:hypothetical protein
MTGATTGTRRVTPQRRSRPVGQRRHDVIVVNVAATTNELSTFVASASGIASSW